MILSKPQVQRFFREWSSACQAQGWTSANNWTPSQVENERHALLLRAGFDSLTKVDKGAGFDRVLAELRALQDDVARTIEVDDSNIGRARRLRHVIRHELLPCLALYIEHPEDYIASIVTSLIRWTKTDRPTRPPTLDDLTADPILQRKPPCYESRRGPSQLDQVIMTISQRLCDKRREAGHSIHAMHMLSHTKCTCRPCRAAAQKSKSETAPKFQPQPHTENSPELDPANAPF